MNKNVLNLHSRHQDKGVQRHCFVFPVLMITQFSAGLVDGLKTDPWLGISDLWLCVVHESIYIPVFALREKSA